MQKLGVVNSKAVIADLTVIAVGVVAIVKKGVGLGSISKIFGLLDEAKDLLERAPGALPELSDLDAVESGELAAAAFTLVKAVIESVR